MLKRKKDHLHDINQTIQVRWNNTLSNVCGISNGVKQGGCLSSTLFSLYINNLIDILRKNSIGCRYGPHYMGVYGYVDDNDNDNEISLFRHK